MYKEFEVSWEGMLPADPTQVWDALTVRTAGWLWKIEYEPRVGGAESGLTSDSATGTVTVWEPPRRFETNAWRSDGWRNNLAYELEPHGGETLLRYTQTGVLQDDEYDEQYDACVQHTDMYYGTLAEYLEHFAGRDAVQVEIEVPGTFAELRRAFGLTEAAALGDAVSLERPGHRPLQGTIDYVAPAFFGVRTDDGLIRVLGRDAWGWPAALALHLFNPEADVQQAQRAWTTWLQASLATQETVTEGPQRLATRERRQG
jgi:hypothetical protein